MTTQELLEQPFEINLSNYRPEDVERLNDWAIKAYAALEALQAAVARLETLAKGQHVELYNARLRLAEIEKQEPVAYFDVCVNGDVGAIRFIPHHGEPLKSGDKLYAAAGASPVEPSQARELPPLPEFDVYTIDSYTEAETEGYSADAMRNYARAIIAAIKQGGQQ